MQASGRVGRRRDERLEYLDRALEIMRRHSINREQVDWDRVRSECLELVRSADDQASLYKAIRHALRGLGDGHSTFVEPALASAWREGVVSVPGDTATARGNGGGGESAGNPTTKGHNGARPPAGQKIDYHTAYIWVPGFLSGSALHITRFADGYSPLSPC